jgi:methylthioadenosine phosphorylase (EC 2.4.2.28)
MKPSAEIGVFGGSGFYSFLDKVEEVKVDTPYGPPSDLIAIGEVNGRRVAFLPRHGRKHTIPPHKINYRANVWAMKELGVQAIISPCAAGSLQPHIKPGDFVVADQYVDRTHGRADTFYEGPTVHHVSPADPYCPVLRQIAIEEIRAHGIPVHERGTIVVINGPRFSTKAESKWFTSMGWEVINMTQYPEAYLALELAIPVVNISLITDYDSGLVAEGEVKPVTAEEVMQVFHQNAERIRKVIFGMIAKIPPNFESPIRHALDYAKVTV